MTASSCLVPLVPRPSHGLVQNAAQLTMPTYDGGQLMSGASGAPLVLWLSTKKAVQVSMPIGDDGQLMPGASDGPPVLWLSSGERACQRKRDRERERERHQSRPTFVLENVGREASPIG